MLELKARLLMKYGRRRTFIRRSNEYTGVEVARIEWRERLYSIIWVDGMLCDIEVAE